jgi:hypothetical protein
VIHCLPRSALPVKPKVSTCLIEEVPIHVVKSCSCLGISTSANLPDKADEDHGPVLSRYAKLLVGTPKSSCDRDAIHNPDPCVTCSLQSIARYVLDPGNSVEINAISCTTCSSDLALPAVIPSNVRSCLFRHSLGVRLHVSHSLHLLTEGQIYSGPTSLPNDLSPTLPSCTRPSESFPRFDYAPEHRSRPIELAFTPL